MPVLLVFKETMNKTTKPDFFLHDKAICDATNVGPGTRIWAFSHVLSGASIGQDCNICEHVFIENRVVVGSHCTIKSGVYLWDLVTLEDGVFVGPSVSFTNDLRPRAFLKRGDAGFLPTLVKRGATIGANATIICGVTLGEYSMVGAGSVVTKDVPAFTVVVGNPARPVGRICYCAAPLDSKDYCSGCEQKLIENSEAKTISLYSV